MPGLILKWYERGHEGGSSLAIAPFTVADKWQNLHRCFSLVS